MAGKIVASTINDDTGVLATQNGMTGIAKAWVNFNGTGTVAIRSAFNVSSITDNGTGNYTVNFTTAMPNANYSVVTGGSFDNSTDSASSTTPITSNNLTTSAVRVRTVGSSNNALDFLNVFVSVFSS